MLATSGGSVDLDFGEKDNVLMLKSVFSCLAQYSWNLLHKYFGVAFLLFNWRDKTILFSPGRFFSLRLLM